MKNIDELIRLALQEDIGDGDHSSLSTIPNSAEGEAKLLIKQNGIIAGIDIAEKVLQQVDASTKMTKLLSDGDNIKSGDIAFTLQGNSISMLTAERTLLNYMQRMSGIATHTRILVQKLKGLNTKILDTRKTTPLMRVFEKMAVRIGGGTNHRFGLYDMVMIKDNHVDFAGGIENAIKKTNAYLKEKKLALKIEIETRNIDEVKEVLRIGNIHRIMLDNFSVEEMREAVQLINGKYETEASGGITAETIRAYAETAVDYISVGAITHQINSLDMSLKAI
jgi:nicotinate-nucleotide pyrophosphorylase (carboxylating)